MFKFFCVRSCPSLCPSSLWHVLMCWVFLFFLLSVLLSRAPASSGIWYFVFIESVFSKPLGPSYSNAPAVQDSPVGSSTPAVLPHTVVCLRASGATGV